MTTQSRRSFVATVGAAALGAMALPRLAACGVSTERRLSPIGIQLYTLRTAMERDLPGTLARVAEIGYDEVEFAGYFGRTPAQIRALLAQHGLASPSTHLAYEQLGPGWPKALADAMEIGHQWVTIPWTPEEVRRTADDWKRVAERYTEAGRAAKAAGLRFAYHNHDYELTPMGGQVPLDILLTNTDPALVDFEMDLYWMVKGGADPLDYFARFPHRFPLVHVKDATAAPERRMVDVGAGTIDFRRIARAREQAGIQHWIVEHDNPTDAFASARASYGYLAALEP
ncbi:MAG TPA: sugar phosphate isomerase/epimerase [Gemmatimonadaceae bacterium]|nr:sugar phosphate isomerase/epimerase [Gemmatimonadaceae bacterium]